MKKTKKQRKAWKQLRQGNRRFRRALQAIESHGRSALADYHKLIKTLKTFQ